MKIDYSKSWSSVGDEFIEFLEENEIDYKVVNDRLEVFSGVRNHMIGGGCNFTLIEYRKKSNNQRLLVAVGGYGIADDCIEEIYSMDLEDDEIYTDEQVANLLREYILELEEA